MITFLWESIESQKLFLIVVKTITKIRSAILPVILFLFIFLIHSTTLMRFPFPFCDEGWWAARAWNFVHTAQPFSILDSGLLDHFDGYWTSFPWITTAIQSAGMFILGPTLLSVRLVSFTFGFLLLSAVFIIGNQIGGKYMGMLAVLITSVSGAFFTASHLARPDILTTALGYSAIALHLLNKNNNIMCAFLSGLIVGIAFETHANGAIFVPVIIVIYMLEFSWKIWKSRKFFAFIGGLSLALASYVVWHIMLYPETFFTIYRIVYFSHIPPILSGNIAVLWTSVLDMWKTIFVFDSLIIPMFIWSCFLVTSRNVNREKILSAILITLILSGILLIRNKLDYYIILYSPAASLLLSSFIRRFFLMKTGQKKLYINFILVMSVVTLNTIISLRIRGFEEALKTDSQLSYGKVIDRINSSLHQNDRIIGPQTYWFGLQDQTLLSWQNILYYREYMPETSIQYAMDQLRPDIILIDGWLWFFINDQPYDFEYYELYRVPRTELFNYLAMNGVLIDEFDDDVFGYFQIYRINW